MKARQIRQSGCLRDGRISWATFCHSLTGGRIRILRMIVSLGRGKPVRPSKQPDQMRFHVHLARVLETVKSPGYHAFMLVIV
jgi:hypothetical protein